MSPKKKPVALNLEAIPGYSEIGQGEVEPEVAVEQQADAQEGLAVKRRLIGFRTPEMLELPESAE